MLRATGNRKQQIAQALEKMLSREGISKSIDLVIIFYQHRSLPIHFLLSLRPFASLNPSLWEIQNYLSQSPLTKEYLIESNTIFQSPCQILFTRLVVVSSSASEEEITKFIKSLNGEQGVEVRKRAGYRFAIDFDSFERLCACWRALSVCKFKGELLECFISTKDIERPKKQDMHKGKKMFQPQRRGPPNRKQMKTPPPTHPRTPMISIVKPGPIKYDLIPKKVANDS